MSGVGQLNWSDQRMLNNEFLTMKLVGSHSMLRHQLHQTDSRDLRTKLC